MKEINWEAAFRELAMMIAEDWSPGGETTRDNGAGYDEAVMACGGLTLVGKLFYIDPDYPDGNLHAALHEVLKDAF